LNQHTKQRLVGAVVLVSLAVIFIPMLLDGGDDGGMPAFGSNIPEKPDYHFEPLEIPLERVEPIPEEKPRLVEKAEPKPAAKPSGPAPEKKAPAKPLVNKEPAQTPPKQSTKQAVEQEPAAWVVQVGSFSNDENALRLRDKLRNKGYKAFVEKLKTEHGSIYRVRIGPELKREDAEAKLESLQREMKIKGIVMGHST